MKIEMNPNLVDSGAPRKHFKRPAERAFTRAERDHTTILFGGLTWSHERLIKGAWEGLGYKCEVVPTPDVKAFQLGKEYGNNGQCNPTYFTVGNLVQYLQGLEEKGLTREEIKRELCLHHRRCVRAVPFRNVRSGVPTCVAELWFRRVPRVVVPTVRRIESGRHGQRTRHEPRLFPRHAERDEHGRYAQ